MNKKRPPTPVKISPPELRPVGARALKSTIDTLRPYIYGARILDLYAGLGRFGLEALAEEAAHVEFVERDKKSAKTLQEALPKGAKAEVHCADVIEFLKKATGAPFDIIFADPPFPLWEEENFGHELVTAIKRVTSADAILMIKAPSRIEITVRVPEFLAWKQKEYGESNLLFFRRTESEEPGTPGALNPL